MAVEARLAALETLRQMVYCLKGEITYSRAPLEEALDRVGRRESSFLGEMFSGAAQGIAQGQGETFFQDMGKRGKKGRKRASWRDLRS